MPNQTKSQRDYKDFCFRRRYDHFLRYRLLEADELETYEAAAELGFKLKITDIEKKMSNDCRTAKNKKQSKKRKGFIGSKAISWLQLIFRKNTSRPVSTKKRAAKNRKKKNKSI